jgi:tetraacyldisaccharide 4'-kinase
MRYFRLLFLPISWLYAIATSFRNTLFNADFLPQNQYPLPIISVGNLTVGGTGKTPLTEFIFKILSKKNSCALLSRGYGRKTKGVIIADSTSGYTTIGDEPMQIKLKFSEVIVAVAENRRAGMNALLSLLNPPDVVVMDDAYQHRYVKPGLSVLVIDYNRPIWKDFCLPAGNLREPVSGKKRAHIIVVNKCPTNLTPQEAESIKNRINATPEQRLFFSSIGYCKPKPLFGENKDVDFNDLLMNNRPTIIAVAGIGNPMPFFEMVKEFGCPVIPVEFADHHNFSKKDIEKLTSLLNKNKTIIVTTEKDAVRLNASPHLTRLMTTKIWYVPIEPEFLFDEQLNFEKLILEYVTKN